MRHRLLPLLLLAPPSAALDLLGPANGDFAKGPKKNGSLPGFAVEGEIEHRDGSLVLSPGASLRAEVALGAPPAPDHLPAEGWFALARIDVLEVEGEAPGELLLEVFPAERDRGLAAATLAVEPGVTGRLSAPIAPEALAACGEGSLWIHVAASGAEVVVDELRLERYHRAPTRKLVGKANGKLGPDLIGCGALGFTALTEHLHGAFSVLDVREGGPAAEAGLLAGDLVVAIEGRPLATSSIAPGPDWFERSHEAAIGRAIEGAVRGSREAVSLTVLRDDGERALSIRQPFRGDLDEGFPLRGALASALHRDLVGWAVDNQKKKGGWPGTDAVNPALGGLALLGTRDPGHRAAIERCVDFLLKKNPRPSEMRGLAYWTIAFQGMLFAEYFLASGDERVRPWMEEALEWLPTTSHESKWGTRTLGHGPDGLPYDNKALMAPMAHLFVFEALAQRCGIESELYEHVEPYVLHSWSDPEKGGHGAMGYNGSYRDKGEFWSRSGLVALASALRGGEDRMRMPLCAIMEERHPWMLNSHAYGEPGAALGLIGLAVAHRPAFERILPQWGWRFLCAWEPGHGLRYSTPHMGAPYMGGESVVNLAYLLVSSVPIGGLVMTGGEAERWLVDESEG